MKAHVIYTPFTRDEYTGIKLPSRKTWLSNDRIYTVELDGKSICVLLADIPPKGWERMVEIVGKESGSWYNLGYSYLGVAI